VIIVLRKKRHSLYVMGRMPGTVFGLPRQQLVCLGRADTPGKQNRTQKKNTRGHRVFLKGRTTVSQF